MKPTISDYIDALRCPTARFRTLGEPEARIDAHGEVTFMVGNSAVIMPLKNGHALKCYIKSPPHAISIYRYVAATADSLWAPCRLLEREIFVHDPLGEGTWHDVVESRWLEGITLETALRRASREGGFVELSALFEPLAVDLLEREWAHGDLKPENIVLVDDGTLCLIDLDAMWLPELAGQESGEVGTPQYQHPTRNESCFCKAVDDFSVALMAVSLRALALDPTLWQRYNGGDNILFYPEEAVSNVLEGGYCAILRLFAEHGQWHSLRLAQALRTPTPAIEGLREMLLATAEDTLQWAYSQEDNTLFEHLSPLRGGVASVCAQGVWAVVCADGSVRASCRDWDFVKPFSEGLAAARRGEKWGYINADARVVAPPIYDMAVSMHEGCAVVGQKGKYGFIDAFGTVSIPLEWDYAGSFRDGRAIVSRGREEFEIDPQGRILCATL